MCAHAPHDMLHVRAVDLRHISFVLVAEVHLQYQFAIRWWCNSHMSARDIRCRQKIGSDFKTAQVPVSVLVACAC